MKNIFTLLCMGLASMLAACETILPVDIPEEEKWGITLNAVASPDTTFKAYVTRCYPSTEAPEYKYNYLTIDGVWIQNPVRHYLYSMLYKYYAEAPVPFNILENYNLIKESTLTDAEVELTVNGKDVYPMEYDTLMLCFQSNYTPVIGDCLEVRINDATGKQTMARTEIPHPQKLEIVNIETELLEKEEYLREPLLGSNKGYVRMKLRLHDPADEKNYYRLVVRGINTNVGNDRLYNEVWDIFQSSAPIFRDERLTTGWDTGPAYFSNVFDDRLINGEAYEFEVKAYVLFVYQDYWPTYEVSLQSITEDYYRYLKSLQLYKISTLDAYSEGVYIHSNNEGGWGLLGGISGEVHRIEPFREKNE